MDSIAVVVTEMVLSDSKEDCVVLRRKKTRAVHGTYTRQPWNQLRLKSVGDLQIPCLLVIHPPNSTLSMTIKFHPADHLASNENMLVASLSRLFEEAGSVDIGSQEPGQENQQRQSLVLANRRF